MMKLPNEVFYEILYYLVKKDIGNFLLTSKNNSNLSNNILWKYLFNRDFRYYKCISDNYNKVYQNCIYSRCDAKTSLHPDNIRPINNMSFAHGPTCGNIWQSVFDSSSYNDNSIVIKLKNHLWWYDIIAQTILKDIGRYRIFWRIKIDNLTCIDELSCYHLYVSDNYNYNTYIHTLTKDFQEYLRKKGGWHLLHTGDVITKKKNVKVTTHLFNHQGYFKDYMIDCVLFLPESVKIV